MQRGDLIEDFELPDQGGVPRRLSRLLADGPVVLFFYPGAMTPGCTKESCHFRDLGAEFAEVGAQRVGISADPPSKQQEFATAYQLDYPLLSDTDGRVAEQFGVRRRLFRALPIKRHTFVIGQDSRLIAEIASEFDMNAHADQALQVLRRVVTDRPGGSSAAGAAG